MLSVVEIGRKVLERKIFKFINIFSLFRNYISLEKGRGPSSEQTWQLVNVFSQFFYYIPLEKGGALYLNKFDPPSPKNSLCKVWLKLALWLKMWNVYDNNNDNDDNDDEQPTNSDQKSLLEPQVS